MELSVSHAETDHASPYDIYGKRWSDKQTPPSERRPDLLKMLFSKFDRSIGYNILKLIISLSKCILAGLTLILAHHKCTNKLDAWFGLMMLNDIMSVIFQALVIKNLIDIHKARNKSILPDLLNNSQELEQRLILYSSFTRYQVSSEQFKRGARTKKILASIRWLKVIFYIGLIIYGQYLFLNLGSECQSNSVLRSTVIVIFLIIGYVYIGIPALLGILGLVWAFCTWISSIQLFKRNPNRLSNADFRLLRNEKFNGNVPGFPECSICMRSYRKEEEIISLNCDIFHHFHKECLRKELNKDNRCPICGVSINAPENNL